MRGEGAAFTGSGPLAGSEGPVGRRLQKDKASRVTVHPESIPTSVTEVPIQAAAGLHKLPSQTHREPLIPWERAGDSVGNRFKGLDIKAGGP